MSEQQKKRRRRKRSKKAAVKKQRRLIIIALCVVIALVLGFLGIYVFAKNTVDSVAKDTVWHNISVDDMSVAGMKDTEVKALLEQKQAEFAATTVVLKAEEVSVEVVLSDLGFAISNVDEVVAEAVSYGKDGGVFSRYKEFKDLDNNALSFD